VAKIDFIRLWSIITVFVIDFAVHFVLCWFLSFGDPLYVWLGGLVVSVSDS